MRIGELARRAGLNASALRYYERLGLLNPPPRAGGKRVYDALALKRLGWIRLGVLAGFKLRELRHLIEPGEPAASKRAVRRSLLLGKRNELARRALELRRMQRLIDAAVACRCESLAGCARARAALRRSAPERS